jgi:glycosyltransferase involved in cell wall biosynthesis
MMNLTVLVPTYRRSQDLQRCLEALKQQTVAIHELLIVVRDEDEETHRFFQGFQPASLPLRLVSVTQPGTVAALNAGLAMANGDIIAITDDDAAPHPDWLEKIQQHFAQDPKLGGLGGRDWMYLENQLQTAAMHPGASDEVGKISWFGRITGNHHIGEGSVRSVDILKGVNMSFRRLAIEGLAFNQALRGAGAQVDNEIDFCLKVGHRGWTLKYDPQVAVDHFLGRRTSTEHRMHFNAQYWCDATYNETLILLSNLSPIRRTVFILWAFLVGTRHKLGIFQLIRFYPQERDLAWRKWQTSVRGRWEALQDWYESSYLFHS